MRGTKKIDWLNHFLEFIVVVIGILLAFQLNTCREGKKEQHLVQRHLTNLMDETSFNEKQLSAAVQQSQRLAALLDTMIDYTSSMKDVGKLNRKAMQLLALDYTYIKKNAYQSLVETGDIRFIEDFELKEDITGLYEYYRWVEGIEESARNSYAEQYFPYVIENLDLIDGTPQTIDVYTNKTFKNYLSVYRYSIDYRLLKQQEVLEFLHTFQKKHQ